MLTELNKKERKYQSTISRRKKILENSGEIERKKNKELSSSLPEIMPPAKNPEVLKQKINQNRRVLYKLKEENIALKKQQGQLQKTLKNCKKRVNRCIKKNNKLLEMIKEKNRVIRELEERPPFGERIGPEDIIEINVNEMTPTSKTDAYILQNLLDIRSEEKERVKKTLLEHHVIVETIKQSYQSKDIKEKQALKDIVKKCEILKLKKYAQRNTLYHSKPNFTIVRCHTHTKGYIDFIGLLRDGQLLAEDSPEEILRKFEVNTLEDAFLKLAMRQQELPLRRRPTIASSPDLIPTNSLPSPDSRFPSREDFSVVTSSTDVLTKKEKVKDCKKLSRSRYNAVFIKCIQQFSRHPGGLIFSVIFPIIQMVAFFSAVGHDPRDLHVAVVNDEAAHSPVGLDICKNKNIAYTTLWEDYTCDLYMLSCWYLEEMEKKNILQLPYNTSEEAKNAVAIGKVYGALHFSTNFSSAMEKRLVEGEVADDVVEDSSISVWLDMSNYQISYYLKNQLHKAYESFTKRAMIACDRNENLVQIPVFFNEPIYGERDAQMVNYMAPGIIITIIFFLPSIVTSTLMISDRLEGVWERSAVAGVKPREMLNVHIMLQSAIIVLQTVEIMALAFLGYGIPSRGNYFVIGVLLFLQGLSGMSYGFLLSVYCSSHTMSFFVATGSFYPMILLCGILWPLEGMSTGLRFIALLLPFTIPAKSLRELFERGSSITEPGIYIGFVVTIVWIFITLGLVLLRLKLKKT